MCYKSIINYDLDIMNILVVSPQICYIEVLDITNPPFNEQIWPVPSDFVKSRFHCTEVLEVLGGTRKFGKSVTAVYTN